MVDRIKALAQAKGHTLASLERAAGISNGTISKWDEHSPTLAKLEKVAQCLDVNLIELFREESTKKAPSQMAEGQSAAKQALVQFILRMPDDQAEELLSELASRLSMGSAPGADPESR